MESNDLDDQVRNIQSDVVSIDIEYPLEDNQRVVNFLTAGTQEDKQRFIDLLHAKIDREWEGMKADAAAPNPNAVYHADRIYLSTFKI